LLHQLFLEQWDVLLSDEELPLDLLLDDGSESKGKCQVLRAVDRR
jgi:hypothetical protein